MSKLLEVNNLAVSFMTQAGSIDAVRDMSFAIEAGKTLAIVGESGSGKSVTAQAVMGILPRVAKIESGEILFHDRPEGDDGPVVTSDIAKLDPGGSAMRHIRGNRISMIFQEPMTSLSPLHTIGDQVSEGHITHTVVLGIDALVEQGEVGVGEVDTEAFQDLFELVVREPSSSNFVNRLQSRLQVLDLAGDCPFVVQLGAD